MNKAEGRSGFCILIVEDDPTLQKIGKAILEHCGCRVEVTGSGREAVEAFARQKFDMIFMDCHMPEMDGYVTTGAIREMENKNRGKSGARRVPIVALTGCATEEDRKECLQAGMDDHLGKPFTIVQMRSVLDRWFSGRSVKNQEDRGEKDSRSMEAQTETAQDTNRREEPPPIDRNALDVIASFQPPGSENILRKVILLYLDSSSALTKSVREAIERTDFDALHRAAHTLKSSSASLGALAFSGICMDLEMMGRNKTVEGAKDRLSALEHEYDRVREALERHCTSLL